MRIIYHRIFKKKLLKLTKKLQVKAKETVLLFREDPFHPSLRNHALKGRYCKIDIRLEKEHQFYS